MFALLKMHFKYVLIVYAYFLFNLSLKSLLLRVNVTLLYFSADF